MAQLVDRLFGDADDVEVDDLAISWAGDDVDDSGHERLDGVTGDDEGAGLHPIGFSSLVEECPDVAGLVDLLDVGGEGDGDVAWLGHDGLPSK